MEVEANKVGKGHAVARMEDSDGCVLLRIEPGSSACGQVLCH